MQAFVVLPYQFYYRSNIFANYDEIIIIEDPEIFNSKSAPSKLINNSEELALLYSCGKKYQSWLKSNGLKATYHENVKNIHDYLAAYLDGATQVHMYYVRNAVRPSIKYAGLPIKYIDQPNTLLSYNSWKRIKTFAGVKLHAIAEMKKYGLILNKDKITESTKIQIPKIQIPKWKMPAKTARRFGNSARSIPISLKEIVPLFSEYAQSYKMNGFSAENMQIMVGLIKYGLITPWEVLSASPHTQCLDTLIGLEILYKPV